MLFAQRNPLEPLDSETNYRCIYLGRAGQEESDYGSPAIRKIYSRWIPQLGHVNLRERISDIVLSRYKNPPRAFSFDYFRKPSGSGPLLGGGCQLEWGFLRDAGARASLCQCR